jgi:uncharacterized repeat protein (TIGR01451 family)
MGSGLRLSPGIDGTTFALDWVLRSFRSAGPSRGSFSTFTITLTAKPGLADGTVITNCAVVYTGKPDTDESNNNSCIDTIVGSATPKTADLTIAKAGPATVGEHGTITYTLAVTDHGPAAATNVVVSDPLAVSFDSVTSLPGECAVEDGAIVCRLATLAVAETKTLTFTVSLRAGAVPGDSVMNCASAQSQSVLVRSPARAAPPASCVQTTVEAPPRADIGIVKSGPARVNPDGTLTYLLVVTNHSLAAADAVVIRDPVDESLVSVVGLPAGCGLSAGTVTCRLGTLAPEEIRELDITLRAKPGTAGSVIENCADAESVTDDPDLLNNESCADTIIGSATPPAARVVITKDGPATAQPGGRVSYTVSVTGHGPDAARDVLVEDPLDAALVTASALPGACSLAARTVICRAGTLAVDETKSFVITVTVGPGVVPGTRLDDCAAASSSVTLLEETPGSWCAQTDVARLPSVPVTG